MSIVSIILWVAVFDSYNFVLPQALFLNFNEQWNDEWSVVSKEIVTSQSFESNTKQPSKYFF
jgi:hypothetical protein